MEISYAVVFLLLLVTKCFGVEQTDKNCVIFDHEKVFVDADSEANITFTFLETCLPGIDNIAIHVKSVGRHETPKQYTYCQVFLENGSQIPSLRDDPRCSWSDDRKEYSVKKQVHGEGEGEGEGEDWLVFGKSNTLVKFRAEAFVRIKRPQSTSPTFTPRNLDDTITSQSTIHKEDNELVIKTDEPEGASWTLGRDYVLIVVGACVVLLLVVIAAVLIHGVILKHRGRARSEQRPPARHSFRPDPHAMASVFLRHFQMHAAQPLQLQPVRPLQQARVSVISDVENTYAEVSDVQTADPATYTPLTTPWVHTSSNESDGDEAFESSHYTEPVTSATEDDMDEGATPATGSDGYLSPIVTPSNNSLDTPGEARATNAADPDAESGMEELSPPAACHSSDYLHPCLSHENLQETVIP